MNSHNSICVYCNANRQALSVKKKSSTDHKWALWHMIKSAVHISKEFETLMELVATMLIQKFKSL